ncbi:MAG TPA: hypothetical protein VGN47_14225 [Blastococcus sp.]|jgi:hypothetical protein|nr:hypothetical protein [Blastococcus sp.]
MTTGAEWLEQARRLVDTFLAAPATEQATEPTGGAAHADTCRWCPLCQVAAVVRGERPEVSAALADVLTATAGALRTFAEDVAPAPAEAPPAAAEESDPAPAVQRIEIA